MSGFLEFCFEQILGFLDGVLRINDKNNYGSSDIGDSEQSTPPKSCFINSGSWELTSHPLIHSVHREQPSMYM